MEAAFEAALGYSEDRTVFGQSVSRYGLSKVKLARMAMALQSARMLTLEVGRLLDAGKGNGSKPRQALCRRAAETVCREALQLHGGMGYAEETAVSRYFVDARVLSIFEGAEETLALKVVGRALLA